MNTIYVVVFKAEEGSWHENVFFESYKAAEEYAKDYYDKAATYEILKYRFDTEGNLL